MLVSKGRKHSWRPPGPVAYQKARESFRALLRTYVDEWIETGRKSNGMERPADRGLGDGVIPKAPVAMAAVARFTRNLPVLFRPEGGLQIFFAPYNGNGALSELAEREAARFFAWFFVSDWRNTVVKCRKPDCGRYFAIKNIQHLYKRGTFCRNHSSAKSAWTITAEKRQKKRELLLRLATAAVKRHQKQGSRERRERPLKYYVTDYVNDRTPPAMKSVAPTWPITAKWVTRNLHECEPSRNDYPAPARNQSKKTR